MQAIQVKYLGPTNTKGARLKAWAASGVSIIEDRDYAIDASKQAQIMCELYAKKMNWHYSTMHFGTLPNQDWVGLIAG